MREPSILVKNCFYVTLKGFKELLVPADFYEMSCLSAEGNMLILLLFEGEMSCIFPNGLVSQRSFYFCRRTLHF